MKKLSYIDYTEPIEKCNHSTIALRFNHATQIQTIERRQNDWKVHYDRIRVAAFAVNWLVQPDRWTEEH